MGSRIIFCTAFFVATIVVILLALLSPNTSHNKSHSRPLFDMSLYIQKPHLSSASSNTQSPPPLGDDNVAAAFIFHRLLTDGPDNNSKVVGKAEGFIIPTHQFAKSPFNVIYITFETVERSGSLSLKAREAAGDTDEEFRVVGGTGAFAFARGVAVFSRTKMGVDATYYVRFQLQFPNQSPTTPV
ncbi:hypothetical protein QN277_000897 [Acacia crassicarpa]|uniref:Dirigent protein n=1 Tax=Acacia crassicarpa TaxID=499986 RepID=A0AAE1N778_9FABA|nr:hypothetical protein QN277_000897 [Acacia crassicarpa]